MFNNNNNRIIIYLPPDMPPYLINLTIKLSTAHNTCVGSFFTCKRWGFNTDFSYSANIMLFSSYALFLLNAPLVADLCSNLP